MASIINSFAISGIEGYLVEIETDTIYSKLGGKSAPLAKVPFTTRILSNTS